MKALVSTWNQRRTAVIAASTCTGLGLVSMVAGLTIVHVSAVSDPVTALKRLNESRYGCGFRSDEPSSPMRLESCWDDWDLVPIDPGTSGKAAASGVRFRAGLILVPLSPGTTVDEFSAQFRSALHHLRLQEVCISPRFLDARAGLVDDVVRQPRYTPADDGTHGYRGARLCDDLYVIDPTDPGGAWRLFWLAVSARLAASDPRRPLWR